MTQKITPFYGMGVLHFCAFQSLQTIVQEIPPRKSRKSSLPRLESNQEVVFLSCAQQATDWQPPNPNLIDMNLF